MIIVALILSVECKNTSPVGFTCSPVFVDDVVQAVLDLLIDEERGMWHLGNGLSINWVHFLAVLAQQRAFVISGMRPWPLAEWTIPQCARTT
ncbi:MAG: hypothetical protein M3Z14_03740 [Candidatus Eremiobacteraeota bacterium]|nr:hypothetical protein [Candidatus Eremiobacteraeota bacterium]